jgi:hypothetical protein
MVPPFTRTPSTPRSDCLDLRERHVLRTPRQPSLTNIGAAGRAVKDEKPAGDRLPIVPEPGGDVAFVQNELREFQPDLAARVEAEIVEGAGTSDDAGALECRVTERDQDGRTRIAVSLAGEGWMVSFTVSQPPAAGEVRMETRKALRDRGRRARSYRRATRR